MSVLVAMSGRFASVPWRTRIGCLKRYGVDHSRRGRHGALLALAARLPAPILAERIGIHQGRAAQWVRLAGASYADYVAIRQADR